MGKPAYGCRSIRGDPRALSSQCDSILRTQWEEAAIDIDTDSSNVRLNMDVSLVWTQGIDPDKVDKIDEAYEVNMTNQWGKGITTTYRVNIWDR